MVAHERLQLGNRLGVTAHCQICLQPQLQRDQSQLLQPADLVAGEHLVLELRERRSAPQPERSAEQLIGSRGITLDHQLPALFEQGLEPLRIELARLDPYHVPHSDASRLRPRPAPCGAATRAPGAP